MEVLKMNPEGLMTVKTKHYTAGHVHLIIQLVVTPQIKCRSHHISFCFSMFIISQ